MMRSFLMISLPLLRPPHPGLRWQLLTLSWSRWMLKWLLIVVTLPHSFLTFLPQRHWWPPRFLRTLQRQHFLMLQWPLLMPFLRWKTLTEPTKRPVRLTCWLRVLSLQHQSHGLPPHGQMCRHRRLTSSRLPCSVPLRTRYAPPLPCVLGGISLLGGSGAIIGAVLGAWFLTQIDSVLVLLRIPAWWNDFIAGLVLLAVLVFDGRLRCALERAIAR